MGISKCNHGENYDTIEDGEIAYDLEHCFLLRAHNVCSANEFCGAAEFGTNARGRYDRRRFTAPDKSPRVRVCARAGFNDTWEPDDPRHPDFRSFQGFRLVRSVP